jgi:hypothetical protein
LLTQPTIEAAAAEAGVAYRTLKGWLARPDFQQAYRQARHQLLERTVARLLALCGQAVETLGRNLTCGRPTAENRAALAILEQATRGVELLDLAARVEALEAQDDA